MCLYIYIYIYIYVYIYSYIYFTYIHLSRKTHNPFTKFRTQEEEFVRYHYISNQISTFAFFITFIRIVLTPILSPINFMIQNRQQLGVENNVKETWEIFLIIHEIFNFW